MKVLITGGTTWFGQSIVERLLDRGHEVICFDECPQPWRVTLASPVTIRQGSVASLGALTEAVRVERPGVIVNRHVLYGPETEEQYLRTVEINVIGALNTFEVAAIAGVPRVVYESSIGVYGTQEEQGDRYVVEDDARFSESPYVFRLTQHVVEELAGRYAKQTGVEVVGVRPSVCHSPLKDKGISKWSNDFVSLPAMGQPMAFPFPADQRSSLIWVDDAAEVYARLVDQPNLNHEIYNTGGHDVSMQELALMVQTILPSAQFSFADREAGPTQPMPAKVSGARAREDLGIELRPLPETLLEHVNRVRAMRE